MAPLTDAEARVLAALDEAWTVELLRRAIAVPSIGGTDAEIEIQHLVADELDVLGCDQPRAVGDAGPGARADQTDPHGAPPVVPPVVPPGAETPEPRPRAGRGAGGQLTNTSPSSTVTE